MVKAIPFILHVKKEMKKPYQEEDSYFIHNGNKYDLNKIWKAVNNDPILKVDIYKLKWMLPYLDNSDADRINAADLTAPLLLCRYENKLLIVDGGHRLLKAVKNNTKHLYYRFVSDNVLNNSLIKENSPHWTKW